MTALAGTNDFDRPALTTASSAFSSNRTPCTAAHVDVTSEDEDLCKNIPPLNRANNTDYYSITKKKIPAIPSGRSPLMHRPIILDNTINIILMIICCLEWLDNIYYPSRHIGNGRVSASLKRPCSNSVARYACLTSHLDVSFRWKIAPSSRALELAIFASAKWKRGNVVKRRLELFESREDACMTLHVLNMTVVSVSSVTGAIILPHIINLRLKYKKVCI